MLKEVQRNELFCAYYAKWIQVYKKGAIREVTMDKYRMAHQWLEKLPQPSKFTNSAVLHISRFLMIMHLATKDRQLWIFTIS